MEAKTYYGDALAGLERVRSTLLAILEQYPVAEALDSVQPIQYCKSRIKEPESMIRKLASKGLPTDAKTAVAEMHDVVGIRVVCSFIDDVYEVSRWLHTRTEFRIVEEKDYIAYPKPNGYRSLHLIVQLFDPDAGALQAEIQLRTIALDFWAALEHQMKYKQLVDHEKMIRRELKRCADEIAYVDISMQTIRDILRSRQ